jgi:hypothetical protein
MTTILIELSTGEHFAIIYSFSFGEMAITAILLAVLVLYSGRWVYDAVYQMWYGRLR